MVEDNVFDIPVAPKKKEEVVTEPENVAVDMVDNSIINASNDAENLNNQVSNPEPLPLPVTEDVPAVEPLPVTEEAVNPTPLVEEAVSEDVVSSPIIAETPTDEVVEEVPVESTLETEEVVEETPVVEEQPPVEDDIKPFAEEFMDKEIKPFEESDTMSVSAPEIVEDTPTEEVAETPEVVEETPEVVAEEVTTDAPVEEQVVETPTEEAVDTPIETVEEVTETPEEEYKLPIDPTLGPIKLSSGLEVPDTLDQDYGVISDIESTESLDEVIKNEPKVIKKKEEKPKKPFNKKPFIIIGIILLIGLGGFFGYKFLFGTDPVKGLNKELTNIGNKISEEMSKNEFVKYLNKNDKMAYILRYNTTLENNYSLTAIGRLSKSEGKMEMNITASDDNHPSASINSSLVDSELYLKVGTSNSYYKIGVLSNGFNLNSAFNLEKNKVIESLTNAITKNIFTNDYTKDTLRVVINSKTKFATKYSITLKNDKINGIIKDFINGLDNSSLIKKFFTEEDLKSIYSMEKKIVMEEYVTSKGVEKIIIQYKGNNLYIVKTDNGYNVVLNDSNVEFTSNNGIIKIVGTNVDSGKKDFEYILSTTKDENSVTLDYMYNLKDETVSSLNIRLLGQGSVLFNQPSNIVDYNTDNGKSDFETNLSTQKLGILDINKVLGILNNLQK